MIGYLKSAMLHIFLFTMWGIICVFGWFMFNYWWESIGFISLLLVMFWYTRISTFRNGLFGFMINKLLDSIGIIGITWVIVQSATSCLFIYHCSHSTTMFCRHNVSLKVCIGYFCSLLPLAMEAPTPISSFGHSNTCLLDFFFFLSN